MPTYDYRCENCGYIFEQFHVMAEMHSPESEPCPKCGEKEVHVAYLTAPNLADPASLGVKKPDREFRNLLKKIKTKTGGKGNIDRYAE